MKLYDTGRRAYVTFVPENEVRLYVCGITPYDSAHLGHIFTFMQYDLLQRRLEDTGHNVKMVRNITDVDEPIYKKAAKLGIAYTELARNETKRFQQTLKELNFIKPFAEPKASEFIEPMSRAVKKLLERGVAYKLEEDILFDTAKSADYKRFSGFNERLFHGLASSGGGEPDRPGKRQPLDFLLWKSIGDPSDPAQWQTELGKGRPGWHIECTVMSAELLGLPFHIHGGGTDLIFPHHSAEIAQALGLGGPCPAKLWLHTAPIYFQGEKMSKSLGNLVFAHDLLGSYDPSAIRLALMNYHHRVGGEWLNEYLGEAERLLTKLRRTAQACSEECALRLLERVRQALDDDLNQPAALRALQEFSCQVPPPKIGRPSRAIITKAFHLLGLQL